MRRRAEVRVNRSWGIGPSTSPDQDRLSGTPDWLLFAARDLKPFEKSDLAPTYVKFVAGAPVRGEQEH